MLSSQSMQVEERTKPLVVVCESFDIAEVLLNDLYYYSGRKGIYFFPFWDVLPYDNFSPHKGLVSQRFQTLNALVKGEVRILVTTPNGMMQRFMPRDLFQKNTKCLGIFFKRGNGPGPRAGAQKKKDVGPGPHIGALSKSFFLSPGPLTILKIFHLELEEIWVEQ